MEDSFNDGFVGEYIDTFIGNFMGNPKVTFNVENYKSIRDSLGPQSKL